MRHGDFLTRHQDSGTRVTMFAIFLGAAWTYAWSGALRRNGDLTLGMSSKQSSLRQIPKVFRVGVREHEPLSKNLDGGTTGGSA